MSQNTWFLADNIRCGKHDQTKHDQTNDDQTKHDQTKHDQTSDDQTKHDQTIITTLNMSDQIDDPKERLCCKKCNQGTKRNLISCLNDHYQEYSKTVNRLIFEQNTFNTIVKKGISRITNRLQFFIQQLTELDKQIDSETKNFQKDLTNEMNLFFHLDTVEKLSTFAHEHYECFYKKEVGVIQKKISEQVKIIQQELQRQYEQVSQTIAFDFDPLKNDFILLDQVFQTISLQDQINQARRGQYKFTESGKIEGLQFDNDRTLVFQKGSQIYFYESDWNNTENNPQQIFNTDLSSFIYKAFRPQQQQKYQWIIYTSNLPQAGIKKYDLIFQNVLQQNIRSVISGIEKVKQLELDDKHQACYVFHGKTFCFYSLQNNQWVQSPITNLDHNFKCALFNQQQTLLLVQQDQTKRIIFYEIEKPLSNPFTINLPIKEEIDFTVHFLNQNLAQSILFVQQQDKVSIILVSLPKCETSVLQQFIIESGSLTFCPLTNHFVVLPTDKDKLFFYALKFGVNLNQQIQFSFYSQLISVAGKYESVQFSQSGRFIAATSQIKKSITDVVDLPVIEILQLIFAIFSIVNRLPLRNILNQKGISILNFDH